MKKSKLNSLSIKYRPKTWDEVLGQEVNNAILKGMIVNKSYETMNSIIVAGKSGGGKTTGARIFARAINCMADNQEDKPCNKCKHCLQFLDEQYPDYLEVDGTTFGKKEDVGHLKKIAGLNPTTRDGVRIILIDEAHGLSSAAWDILLKDLEEGRNKTVWIFATTELHGIRPAIQGRNPVFKIKPLSQAQIKQELTRICELEGIKIQPKVLSDISRIYRGRTRDAISELDKYYKAFGKDLTNIEINIQSQEDILLKILITAITDTIVSANVDLDRAEILDKDISTAISNILTACYLRDQDEDLFDLGVSADLLEEFCKFFPPKDLRKLISLNLSYDLTTIDKFKLYIMLVKELSINKQEASIVDKVLQEDKKPSLQRRGLKIGKKSEQIEVTKKVTKKVKPKKSKTTDETQMLDLGFEKIN